MQVSTTSSWTGSGLSSVQLPARCFGPVGRTTLPRALRHAQTTSVPSSGAGLPAVRHAAVASRLHARANQAGGGTTTAAGPRGGTREGTAGSGATAATTGEGTAREGEERKGESGGGSSCSSYEDVASCIVPTPCNANPNDVAYDDAFTDVASRISLQAIAHGASTDAETKSWVPLSPLCPSIEP